MNCLVLGGNGFIGSHLVDKLLNEKHQVRVFDKYEERYRPPVPCVQYCYGDFGNRGVLAEALLDTDIVFHLINTTLPKTSNDDPAFDVQSNVINTLYLLEQSVLQKVKKVVFISSGGTVYGLPPYIPIGEDCPTNPICSYGIAKLAIEKYLGLFKYLYDLDYTILRPSNPFGIRQDPLGMQGAVSVFLGRAVRGEVITICDGEVVRDYIFIDDLIEGVYKAAVINTKSRIFNLGSGAGMSLNKVLETIRSVTNCEFKINYVAKRAFDVPKIVLDISRAKEELGWAPVVPFEAGLTKMLEFINRAGNKSKCI